MATLKLSRPMPVRPTNIRRSRLADRLSRSLRRDVYIVVDGRPTLVCANSPRALEQLRAGYDAGGDPMGDWHGRNE